MTAVALLAAWTLARYGAHRRSRERTRLRRSARRARERCRLRLRRAAGAAPWSYPQIRRGVEADLHLRPHPHLLRPRPGSSARCRPTRGSRAGSRRDNRDYDPTTGTFSTRDPLDGINGTTTVTNPYHYADNDPLNMVDPTGLRASDADFGTRAPSPRMQLIRFQQAPRHLNDALRGALSNPCSVGVGPTPDVGAGRAAYGARTGRFLKRMLAIHPFADLGDLEDDKCYSLPRERSPGVDFDFLGIHKKNITQMEKDVCTSLPMIGHCRVFNDVTDRARRAADQHFGGTGQQDGGKWNAALHMFTSAFSALEQGLDYAEFFMNLHEWANPNPFPHLNQMDLLNNYYAFRIVEQALIDEGQDRGDWFEGDDLNRVRNRVTEDSVQFINDDMACEVQREENPFEPGKDMYRFFIRPERCGV